MLKTNLKRDVRLYRTLYLPLLQFAALPLAKWLICCKVDQTFGLTDMYHLLNCCNKLFFVMI